MKDFADTDAILKDIRAKVDMWENEHMDEHGQFIVVKE